MINRAHQTCLLALAGFCFGWVTLFADAGQAIGTANKQSAVFNFPTTSPVPPINAVVIPLADAASGYQVLNYNSTGVVLLKNDQNYARWKAGQLDVLFPAGPAEHSTSTNDTLNGVQVTTRSIYQVSTWMSRNGNVLLARHSKEYISRYDFSNWQNRFENTVVHDSLDYAFGSGPKATYDPDPYQWTTLWDGYLWPSNFDMKEATVYGLDDNGVAWTKLVSNYSKYDGGAGDAYNLSYNLFKLNPATRQKTPTLFDLTIRGNSFNGVSSNGTAIGTTSAGNFVGTTMVDYQPIFINDNDTVIGLTADNHYKIYFADGRVAAVPDDVIYPYFLDAQDRLYAVGYLDVPLTIIGTTTWALKRDANGKLINPPVYESASYQPINLPAGWTTAQQSAPAGWTLLADNATYADKNGVQTTGPVMMVSASLAVDANRDGTIKLPSEDSTDATSAATPFRFWINDDDDSGDMGGSDIPGQTTTANYADNIVNGTRDLVDFFPVYLDLKQLLTVLPPSASVKYKLKQAGNALNFVYTNLARDTTTIREGALAYQMKVLTTGFGPDFTQAAGAATTQQITAAGVELLSAFLTGVKDSDWGVLLIEGRAATTAPLVLSVEKDGTSIAEVKLELRISNVEDMFRHLNLRAVAKNYNDSPAVPSDLGSATKMIDPGDPLPDSTTNGKYFVFVHGYNVDAAQDRGWEAEIFKRMFVMGSHARFVGVSWYGSTGVDYHKAVFHAFQTGDVLNSQLGLPAGADVTVVAHSLGNMVVSQAIQNGGFSPARYYMVNAAVPLEAYDYNNGSVTTEQRTAMTEHKWKTESASIFSANWHQLFGATPSDHRNDLKWKDRFSGVLTSTAVYNFYSPGDNVVENPEWDSASLLGTILAQGFNFSRGAWVTNEFAKGANIVEFPAIALFSRVQGGWGQSVNYWPTGPSKRSADQTREPYFGYFLEDVLFDPDATKASPKAGEKIVQYDLLARGIPALSFATAVNPLAPLAALNRNFDMEAHGRTIMTDLQGHQTAVWPTEGHTGDSQSVDRWLHSDFKNVALPYVYQMYQEMINRGSLQ